MNKPSERAKRMISRIDRLYNRFLVLPHDGQLQCIALVDKEAARCTDKNILEVFTELRELLVMNLKPEKI